MRLIACDDNAQCMCCRIEFLYSDVLSYTTHVMPSSPVSHTVAISWHTVRYTVRQQYALPMSDMLHVEVLVYEATSCLAATSVHALPSVCMRLEFLCPTWQRPASSKMASLRARSLFLLENSALKFDWSGVEKWSKHANMTYFKAGIN